MVSVRGPATDNASLEITVDTDERAARPGELCTCGRPAVVVYSNEKFGDAGYCGVEGSAADPVLPCPWCGTTTPHRASYGDPERCPSYSVRPPGS